MANETEKTSPLNSEAINEKIEAGEIKIKAKRRSKGQKADKKEKQAKNKAKANNKAPSDGAFYEALKVLCAVKKAGVTSRQLSDEVAIKDADFGRGAARQAMKRLTAKGDVNTEIVSEGKVKFKYSPTSPK